MKRLVQGTRHANAEENEMKKSVSVTLKASLMFVFWCLQLSICAADPMVGYEFTMSEGPGEWNSPILRFSNTSSSAFIESFSITIGDQTRYFDIVSNVVTSPGITYDLSALPLSLRTVNEDDGEDVISLSNFGGFAPGGHFQFGTDVDSDTPPNDLWIDSRYVLFDLGGGDPSDNSVITVMFSGGYQLTGHLPDFQAPDGPYVYSQSMVVPLPPSIAVALLGLVQSGVILSRRKREQGLARLSC